MQVLFIAYHFPPIGGAGSQRSAKFVRYLPEFGVGPVVVAGPADAHSRWEPEDRSQSTEISEATPVYRPEGPPPELSRPSRLGQLAGRASHRDSWWQNELSRLGDLAIREHEIDVVYVTLSPYEALESAVGISRKHGLPLVADFRDPWALDEVRLYPTGVHRSLERNKMRRLLAMCDAVIANTNEARVAILDCCRELDPARVVVIPNGFDRSDFESLAPRTPDGRFRIVHAGYLHTSMGLAQGRRRRLKRVLRGDLVSVDFLARSHAYLLEALEQLGTQDPDLASRIDVVLAGVLSADDRRLVEESSVSGNVRVTGYLEHREAVGEMVQADALFLPMHAVADGYRARIVPGKTYEYLATGHPILAAVPAGDARDLIMALRAGIVVDPSDVSAIAQAIVELAQGPTDRSPSLGDLAAYERRELTRQLALLIHDVAK